MKTIVHLTASPFFGGPERQMLGLAESLRGECRSIFVSFAENGKCRPFLDRLRQKGFETAELKHNTPHFRAAIQEVSRMLRTTRADLLCCHGYKPDLLGLPSARRAGIPAVAVSRGWTGASRKVKVYEAADKVVLRFMDAVVCVSQSQALKVQRIGVPSSRVHVIRNAIDPRRFANPDSSYRRRLQKLFRTRHSPRRFVIGAAGRLSPEKGFCQLVDAAALIATEQADAGLVIFGDGPLKDRLLNQIEDRGLADTVVLAGFRQDLDAWLPALDVFVLPSLTEGLPNVALEALAAKVPVVATAVGGTPEVVVDGECGYLVPAKDSAAMARQILKLLRNDDLRFDMGRRGCERIGEHFTFAAQAEQYLRLFGACRAPCARAGAEGPATRNPAPVNARRSGHKLLCN